MAFFKEIWQYTQAEHGFTEVYYSNATNLSQAADFPSTQINLALAMRDRLTFLRKIRVSDVANNRTTVVIPINRAGTATSSEGPDVCSTTAVVTLSSTSVGSRRQLWLRGLNDADVMRFNGSGLDNISPILRAGINAWIAYLARTGYVIQSLRKLTVPPNAYSRVISITVATPGAVTVQMAAGWSATSTNRVILSQIDQKLFPGINGHWAISNVASTVFTIAYNSHLANGTYTLTKGRSRPEEYEYGAITAGISGFNKFGSRDTGRSPLGGRGRRSSLVHRSA
jgi:hypothetical protein